jgi:sulfate permease, SulP family
MRLRQPVLFRLYKQEFGSYSRTHFQRDLIAGLTVSAVALPLALAFGVASGATAAAGLVTAIIAGVVIGALSGAPYQISGPTGAMSAVLILVGQQHGLQGIWVAGVMAGFMILALGIFRLGRIVNFIPVPVITGFTSGIALIILIGQIDNALGIETEAAESTAIKLVNYFSQPLPAISYQAVLCTLLVGAVMVGLPRVPGVTRLPAALFGIVVVTVTAWLLGWDVATIGAIPRSIILDDRLTLSAFDLSIAGSLIGPAAAIAALGSIESLLAGVVAGRMTGTRLEVNQELVGQGIGNIVIPFFGGVPATAAIARISVAVKAGGMTRMVSFIHSGALLASALLLSRMIAAIPLAALAGVLIVTSWRMNEWHVIRFYVHRRMVSPVLVMLVTMLATVAFDLTQAILIGLAVSLLFFLVQVSRLTIVPTDVDWDRMRKAGLDVTTETPGVKVVYISGSLFFGAVQQFIEAIESLPHAPVLILSMRGVPMADVSCVHALEHLWDTQRRAGGQLLVTGLQPQVRRVMDRSGLVDMIGEDRFFWSADQAILAAADFHPDGRPQAPLTSDTPELDDMPLGVVRVD